jgi:hypothetical protein
MPNSERFFRICLNVLLLFPFKMLLIPIQTGFLHFLLRLWLHFQIIKVISINVTIFLFFFIYMCVYLNIVSKYLRLCKTDNMLVWFSLPTLIMIYNSLFELLVPYLVRIFLYKKKKNIIRQDLTLMVQWHGKKVYQITKATYICAPSLIRMLCH